MNSTPITIAGNAADAPELRFTPSGRATAKVRIAVNSRYQDTTGRWIDGTTSWHTIIVWGAMAENLAESIDRGDRVLAHGRLEQREYETETGDKRTIWEITADEVAVSLRHATARPSRTQRAANQDSQD